MRRALALEVEAIARNSAVPWPARRLAALVLETLALRDRELWGARLGFHEWGRLARNRRIHRLASRRDDEAFDEFVAASEHECRLTLARYLFSPDDVIARIDAFTRHGDGKRDPGPHGQFANEAARVMGALPEMERAIVDHLAAYVHWVAKNTPRTMNALVENPVGTVVLTIKPPGSDIEIEVKRAGRPRPRPLVIRRHAIKSHRLDGGSMYHHLVFEAKNSAFLSRVYREIHGVEAPICRTVAILKIDGEMTPAQAIQVGTTSFRLDVVRNAREMLEEIIDGRPETTYLSAMRQVGTFWGTLIGLRGYSEGESFVVRNVGLRKVWENGAWRVKVIFMDHDALSFASVGVDAFDAEPWLRKAELDAMHVFGKDGELEILREIYGVSRAVRRRGIAEFQRAMKRAYRRTLRALPSMPHYFRASFVASLRAWDAAVRRGEVRSRFLRRIGFVF